MKFTLDSLDFIFGRSFLEGKSFSESMTFETEDDLFYVLVLFNYFVDIDELKRF
jgi:hypothetical protein